jgi:hypothetical protein
MLVYLAARYSRHLEMRAVRVDLEGLGFTVTSRWINGDHQISDEGLSEDAKEAERIRFATEDLSDLERASTVVAFTEQPRSTTSRGGRHVELGIALGRKMRVVVVGPRENVFCCLPDVEWYCDYATCLKSLTAESRRGVFGFLHRHPKIEYEKAIPAGHVVVDEADWEQARRRDLVVRRSLGDPAIARVNSDGNRTFGPCERCGTTVQLVYEASMEMIEGRCSQCGLVLTWHAAPSTVAAEQEVSS